MSQSADPLSVQLRAQIRQIHDEVEAQLDLASVLRSRAGMSYGGRVGSRWREFKHSVDAHIQSDEDRQRAVASACATFRLFGTWMAMR